MGVVQADMSAEDAIKFINSFLNGEGNQANQTGKVILALALARKALEEKVEREKAEKKPSLTLNDIVKELSSRCTMITSRYASEPLYPGTHAALNIIKALDEHVMPELKGYDGSRPFGPLFYALRKALGDYL